MAITKKTVAGKLRAYLHHRQSLAQLVDWSENALMDGVFSSHDAAVLSKVIPRLGLADVRAFGLTWDDCEQVLTQLGYSAQVEIVAVDSASSTVREKPAKKYGR